MKEVLVRMFISGFPATRLLMDTILASGAAVCSLAYNYRKEILEGMHVISDTALKCFRVRPIAGC